MCKSPLWHYRAIGVISAGCSLSSPSTFLSWQVILVRGNKTPTLADGARAFKIFFRKSNGCAPSSDRRWNWWISLRVLIACMGAQKLQLKRVFKCIANILLHFILAGRKYHSVSVKHRANKSSCYCNCLSWLCLIGTIEKECRFFTFLLFKYLFPLSPFLDISWHQSLHFGVCEIFVLSQPTVDPWDFLQAEDNQGKKKRMEAETFTGCVCCCWGSSWLVI